MVPLCCAHLVAQEWCPVLQTCIILGKAEKTSRTRILEPSSAVPACSLPTIWALAPYCGDQSRAEGFQELPESTKHPLLLPASLPKAAEWHKAHGKAGVGEVKSIHATAGPHQCGSGVRVVLCPDHFGIWQGQGAGNGDGGEGRDRSAKCDPSCGQRPGPRVSLLPPFWHQKHDFPCLYLPTGKISPEFCCC